MENHGAFVEKILAYLDRNVAPALRPTVSEDAVVRAERRLGFSIPALLKECYLKVGNGGFGPGYGVIGIEEGHKSDYGDLVETYELLKSDQATESRTWKSGLLPFCEWGCNIFSCVACEDSFHNIYTYEDFGIAPQNFAIEHFFEYWMTGVDILSLGSTDLDVVEFVNPFTGKKDAVSHRKRR